MDNNKTTSFLASLNAIAVLDIGVSTQKMFVADPSNPDEILSYQRIFFPLKEKKDEFETFIKSLLRSYSDFGIRTFILTTTAAPVFSSDKETVEFITKIVSKYVQNVICYSSDGTFVSIAEANKTPEKIVSASWRALGESIKEYVQTDALIVEFSTRSVSLIPICENKICSVSKTDFERIKKSELLFYGLLETNVAIIENPFVYENKKYYLPFEKHASTADLFILSNDLQTSQMEHNLSLERLKERALSNLAKVFCIVDQLNNKEIIQKLAFVMRNKLINQIKTAIKLKLQEYSLNTIVLVGLGSEILYQYLSKQEDMQSVKIVQEKDLLLTEFSPAYAIARIYSSKKL
ncbi:MAG: hypothetical protein ACTSQE_03295 [Candidatus Heimdallarchaeaceae archaeon]